MRPYGTSWVLIDFYAFFVSLCFLMCPYGSVCVPKGFNASLKVFLRPYGTLWIFIGLYVFLCVLMRSYVFL